MIDYLMTFQLIIVAWLCGIAGMLGFLGGAFAFLFLDKRAAKVSEEQYERLQAKYNHVLDENLKLLKTAAEYERLTSDLDAEAF